MCHYSSNYNKFIPWKEIAGGKQYSLAPTTLSCIPTAIATAPLSPPHCHCVAYATLSELHKMTSYLRMVSHKAYWAEGSELSLCLSVMDHCHLGYRQRTTVEWKKRPSFSAYCRQRERENERQREMKREWLNLTTNTEPWSPQRLKLILDS